MRKFFVVGLAALLIIGVIGAVAVANAADDGAQVTPPGNQATPPAWGQREGKAGPPLFGLALGLDQQQLDSLNNLRQEQSKAMQQLADQVRDLQSQYQEALKNNDKAQIASLRDQFGVLQDQMVQLRNDYQAKMLDVLTPEQQQLLDQYKAQGGPSLFGGFGRRGRFGPRGGGFGHPGKPGSLNDNGQNRGL